VTDPIDRVRAALAGSYAIVREVGQGGMATVYLANDLKHDREVALKVLRPELAAAMGADRFLREIRIVAQLSHPHILPLHDSGEADGLLFYVMPFVDGESLREKLQRDGAFTVHETVRILREVADALAYAHGRGIVHRDIKPDNVMLSRRHAIVTDFGVAKAVSEASDRQLTTVGVALGTPAYMSPEQATGEDDIDHRSDIYSLGVLGYEMLAGAPPFERPTPRAVLSAHVLDRPDVITTKRGEVPPVLAELIMRCLNKQRDDRWQSADHLLPLLEAAGTTSGGMTPTHTRPLDAATIRRGSRRRFLGAAAGTAIVALAGFGIWTTLSGDSLPGPDRIAVLPINDRSGSDAELVAYLHDQLNVALGQATGLTVTPSSAIEPYRSQPKPSAEIARDLRVGALVEGNVFRVEDRIRISLQLTDPHSIAQLWSDSFEIDLSRPLFEAVDTVVEQIVQGIRNAVAEWTTPS
jgi:serine/threonine-protein kinase